jgi:transcriptional regulator with XRE-family HTH domain
MEKDILNRIKHLMDYFSLTPSKLADILGVNRSRLSHILNGRNKPSLEIVISLLDSYPELNPEWLMFGKEPFLRSKPSRPPKNLLEYVEVKKFEEKENKADIASEADDIKEITDKSRETTKTKTLDDSSQNNGITKIIVYFSNQTFQEFKP